MNGIATSLCLNNILVLYYYLKLATVCVCDWLVTMAKRKINKSNHYPVTQLSYSTLELLQAWEPFQEN